MPQRNFFIPDGFVESLLTQTLVLLVIRTAGNPFHNRPSRSLALSVLAIAGVGIFIPFSPVGALLGFVPIPFSYLIFLFGATGTYLAIVEMVKRRLMRTWLME
jgi:Mg2+-importing ATPase